MWIKSHYFLFVLYHFSDCDLATAVAMIVFFIGLCKQFFISLCTYIYFNHTICVDTFHVCTFFFFFLTFSVTYRPNLTNSAHVC